MTTIKFTQQQIDHIEAAPDPQERTRRYQEAYNYMRARSGSRVMLAARIEPALADRMPELLQSAGAENITTLMRALLSDPDAAGKLVAPLVRALPRQVRPRNRTNLRVPA